MAEKRMTLERLYKDYASDGKNQKKAVNVLNQIDWLTCNVAFDPISGTPTPLSLSEFISRVARRDLASPDYPHDRLWHLVDHCAESVRRIIRDLNENPARAHEVMHLQRVRELDASSFVKLSMRPGRNIREKLSSNPYLQAVKRYMSVDLAENRLFKTFVRRLAELLELRWEMQKAVKGSAAEMHPLLDEIVRWLRSDVAAAISDWENTPPNNTLLSHKDYKKVWDAWRWMQTLDEDVDRDCAVGNANERKRREDLVRFWDEYVLAWKKSNDVKLVEAPLFFDYDTFEIHAWEDSLCLPLLADRIRLIQIGDVREASEIACSILAGELRRSKEVAEPTCVDLMQLSPCYAIDDKVRTLPIRLAWQNWQTSANNGGTQRVESGAEKNVSFGLSGADAIWRHPDATTVAFADLFGGSDCKLLEELQLRAAHACAEELKKIFIGETLVWLMPDGVSEFELKAVRGSLNAAFENACPLPRSIAAIYEKVDFLKLPRERIQKRGYGVLVLDTTDAGVLATNMTVRYSAELEKKVPATLGYYWERNPSVLLTDEIARSSVLVEFDAIDENGKVCAKNKRESKWRQFSLEKLRQRKDLGDFGDVVNLSSSPVVGGLKVYQLQQMAGKIPLWRDNLPLLSIEVIDKDGLPCNFYLVGKKTGAVASTLTGEEVVIPVEEEFNLPVNLPYYSLPLHQGAGNRKLNFAAYIKPEQMIRDSDVDGEFLRCKLRLTYKYGADDPYRLVFYPVSRTKTVIKPMKVEWRRGSGSAMPIELPFPSFPAPKTWDDLQRYPDRNSNGTINLLAELQKRLVPLLKDEEDVLIENAIKRKLGTVLKYRQSGEIKRVLKDYCFVTVEEACETVDVFCHYADFLEEDDFACNLEVGDTVYLTLVKFEDKRTHESRCKGTYVSVYAEASEEALRDAVTARLATGVFRSKTLQLQRERQSSQEEDPYFHALECALKRSMFFVYTIWNYGRSLRDADVPNDFRVFMSTAIQRISELMNDDGVPEKISNKALLLLSALHVDAFDFTGPVLRDATFSPQLADFNRFSICLPYVIGNLDLPEQEHLLLGVLARLGKHDFCPLMVVSKLAWRCERMMARLTDRDVIVICDDLIAILRSDYVALERKCGEGQVQYVLKAAIRRRKNLARTEAEQVVRRRQCETLTWHLELLLALLRTRGSSDPKVKNIFQLDAPYCIRFKKAVQEIGKLVVERGYEIKTRLQVELKKPAGNTMPDLLYALQLYLSGSLVANAISIVGISDNEESEALEEET